MNIDTVKINRQSIAVKEFDGQKVITLRDVDLVHQRSDGTAGRNFRQNRKRFIEGKDYFQRNSSEARNELGIVAPNGLILLTEMGYLMLVKSFTDELAWKVQRQLVETYFRAKDMRKEVPKSPVWFIRDFENKHVVLQRDFIDITGVNVRKHKLFYRREYFTPGADWNGWGWKCDNDEFRETYGFDYGNEPCMMYLTPRGVTKALSILEQDRSVNLNQSARGIFLKGFELMGVSVDALPTNKPRYVTSKRPLLLEGIELILQDSLMNQYGGGLNIYL